MRRPGLSIAITATLLLIAASLLLLSCNRKDSKAEAWVVKVNGEPLSVRVFEGEFARMTYGMDPVDKKASQNVAAGQALLQNLVENMLLAAEARHQGVIVAREEAAGNTARFFSMMNKTERKKYLDDLKLTEEDLVNHDLTGMLVTKYLRNMVFARISMKTEDLKKYYEEHPECYRMGERVRVRMIVTATEDEAKKALERLEAGEDFAKLASEISITPEKDRGGDLGWLERGQFPEPFDQIFFELPENKLSDIVRGDFGWHIIKVVDHRQAVENPPFEKVEKRVRECYFDQARREAELNERKRLLDEAQIEYNPKYAELKVKK